MAVVQTYVDNEPKVSLPRRIATYITSMNFAKVFRRHRPRASSPPAPTLSEKPSWIHHHRYPRPFSYHIPATEQLTPSSLTKTSNVVPYRIGLSSDSTLLANGHSNETDDIVRLPVTNGRGQSPKTRKDRRFHSQLTANKRWLFQSMETLDGWKGKVFPQKNRPTNQSRSRSVENLAEEESTGNAMINGNSSRIKQQRALSPNRSIEAITNRVISSIGIHRKSTHSIPNMARSPALTVQKQAISARVSNDQNSTLKRCARTNPSAILDFREISSLGFLQSKQGLNDEQENISSTLSETVNHDNDSSDEENEEASSNLSFLANGYDPNGDETADSWDFSITWIDSLKEQHSPQRKIQFYENLIKLLEQDTLNIDELLVLRKVLSKIWPTDESTTTDQTNQPFPTTIGTKSLYAPNKTKLRPKIPKMTQHSAQRCSTTIEPMPSTYETLHQQNSGHEIKPTSSILLAAKAKPCFIENNPEHTSDSNSEQNYPQHLNPFGDEIDDIIPSAPPNESDPHSNESIRRYFERLTLLETIYEKLNIESNKTPTQSTKHHHHHQSQSSTLEERTELQRQNYRSVEKCIETKEEIITHHHHSPTKSNTNKVVHNKFLEMNVDGNGSISSGKSSLKRRAPTAPHITQKDHRHNPTMFTLSSTDVNPSHKTNQEIDIPIRFTMHDQKLPTKKNNSKERTPSFAQHATASCDDDGHIFVYDPDPTEISIHIHEEQTVTLPRPTDRIHQWLSSCETKNGSSPSNHVPHNISPKSQLKMRCIAKPIRMPSSSPPRYCEPNLPLGMNNPTEPNRYRSCLKINLETNEPSNHRSRASSAASRHPRILDEDFDATDAETFSHGFQRDHQAVFL